MLNNELRYAITYPKTFVLQADRPFRRAIATVGGFDESCTGACEWQHDKNAALLSMLCYTYMLYAYPY